MTDSKIDVLKSRLSLCKECPSPSCAFNPEGICMFPLLYGKTPTNKYCFICESWVQGRYTDRYGEADNRANSIRHETDEELAKILHLLTTKYKDIASTPEEWLRWLRSSVRDDWPEK